MSSRTLLTDKTIANFKPHTLFTIILFDKSLYFYECQLISINSKNFSYKLLSNNTKYNSDLFKDSIYYVGYLGEIPYIINFELNASRNTINGFDEYLITDNDLMEFENILNDIPDLKDFDEKIDEKQRNINDIDKEYKKYIEYQKEKKTKFTNYLFAKTRLKNSFCLYSIDETTIKSFSNLDDVLIYALTKMNCKTSTNILYNSIHQFIKVWLSEDDDGKKHKEILDEIPTILSLYYQHDVEKYSNSKLLKKVKDFGKTLEINNKINCDDYDNIFITSDIRSDFKSFLILLKDNGIIQYDENIATFIQFNEPHNPKIITDVKWAGGNKTLFLILGNIVDGNERIYGEDIAIDDKKGNFELLIHAFIHNLRIQARKQKSDVLFTFGEHDFYSVLLPEKEKLGEFYSDTKTVLQSNFVRNNHHKNNVHYSAIKFFKTYDSRRSTLLPFYCNSPYFFLIFNNNFYNIMCSHHIQDSIFGQIQQHINKHGLLKLLPNIVLKEFRNSKSLSELGYRKDDCTNSKNILIFGFDKYNNNTYNDNNHGGNIYKYCYTKSNVSNLVISVNTTLNLLNNNNSRVNVNILKLSKSNNNSQIPYDIICQLNGKPSEFFNVKLGGKIFRSGKFKTRHTIHNPKYGKPCKRMTRQRIKSKRRC